MSKQDLSNLEFLVSAPERIRRVRSAEVELHLIDNNGEPLPNARARVQLLAHEFKFGCNAFGVNGIADDGLQRAYDDRFVALLNYATLPFYWGSYERTKGATGQDRVQRMADWCAGHRIATKGHPLVWHEVFPAWGRTTPDDELMARLEKRVREIVSQFQGSIEIWDVVNEATVSHRFDNAVGRWVADQGAVSCVAQALRWAREANPAAILLYNDFNVSEDMEVLIAALLDQNAPLDAIGIQSHMHKGVWPLDRVWKVCETYARFGLPLHWTELTILSGRLKAAGDNDWHFRHTDWVSTPQGESVQDDYGTNLYTLLFSHPAVEAITWWDFSDHNSWQGAPSGLIRQDMSPKPLYERLLHLVRDEWSTDEETTSDENRRVGVRCFFGRHQINVTLANGARLAGWFDLCRQGERRFEIKLQPV